MTNMKDLMKLLHVWEEAAPRWSVALQAFLIAFTSDFLSRLLYQYKFDKEDLGGFVNFTLAYAPLNYTQYPMCRYVSSANQTIRISGDLDMDCLLGLLILACNHINPMSSAERDKGWNSYIGYKTKWKWN